MLEKFKQIADPNYLFNPTPFPNPKVILILVSVFSLMLILGIVSWFLFHKISQQIFPYKKMRNKLTSLFLTCGIIGLLLTFFYWQSIPYLSTQILILILIFVFVLWSLIILLYIQRQFSWELVKCEREERYKKYLPRAKSRDLPRQRRVAPRSKKRRK